MIETLSHKKEEMNLIIFNNGRENTTTIYRGFRG